jgi:nanoRNase/pAp phosphatase (c-di-AMP/oligoRNAs hydrolase)
MKTCNEFDNACRKVDEFFDAAAGRRLVIQVHDVPDPDALASAEAFRAIASARGFHSMIVAHGFPQRRENRALIKACGIAIRSLDSIHIVTPGRYAWVYVDCLPGNGNLTLHEQAPGDLFLAIDHHAWAHRREFEGKSIYITDSTAGATATIMTRLLIDHDIEMTSKLASALSYAIITDTMDFSRGETQADLESFGALFPLTNQRIISRLRNVTKPRQYFRTVHHSLDNAAVYRHAAWVYCGEVGGGEIVAEMADFILSCERITWALAIGRCGLRLFMSMRSSNPKAHCGLMIGRVLAHMKGAVGGHDQFAGGYVELDAPGDADAAASEIIERFVRILYRIPHLRPVPPGSPLAGE